MSEDELRNKLGELKDLVLQMKSDLEIHIEVHRLTAESYAHELEQMRAEFEFKLNSIERRAKLVTWTVITMITTLATIATVYLQYRMVPHG